RAAIASSCSSIAARSSLYFLLSNIVTTNQSVRDVGDNHSTDLAVLGFGPWLSCQYLYTYHTKNEKSPLTIYRREWARLKDQEYGDSKVFQVYVVLRLKFSNRFFVSLAR